MKSRYINYVEIGLIVILASIPLFSTFPYRVNIFLSWEGAYRMSNGEVPFRDFGLPMGGMYWAVPAIFFKLFGPAMITLVKAQVFLNILSGLAFRSILKSFKVSSAVRFSSILLFCLSYSFFNFWPWYNHTVIVYELVGLAFLLKALAEQAAKKQILLLVLAAFFTMCSFFTKQDAGALAVLISLAVAGLHSLQTRKWRPALIFGGTLFAIGLIVILYLSRYGFGYWFNHGQAPHSARISLMDIVQEFFIGSMWIKFYLFIIAIVLLLRFRTWKDFWTSKTDVLFLFLTIAILAEAAVFQVTSYTPPDNNIFFHSFAIAFILAQLSALPAFEPRKRLVFAVLTCGILLWWSNVYWRYIERVLDRAMPKKEQSIASAENVVNKQTYMIFPKDTVEIPLSEWTFSDLKSFKNIYMPAPTIDGMKRLLNMDIVKQKKDLSVLNMSELTPLAVEMPYKLEKGEHYPLWYHLGVGMFNKQAEMFEKNIADKKYDLVLFENIPTLNNFYPFRVRDSLKVHYQMVDSFFAPRRGDTKGMIEVYVR
ncbi:hypothetical protein LZZ85_21240 [Terrimonas sp. NA20]|uniref:Glycosyltransferase RgtA/B/C/D-like domain-containing protein n=1 Tax=Terrimonas ginsenosidimutans TaxID=2908004 RepID=A0ABS9KWY8_9BACT|nr:hypothetical protein [Terrimonas ginsenosidimutans]MCG2616835.1 hypothetical protein [Terrimonas ginsenosidimutans]